MQRLLSGASYEEAEEIDCGDCDAGGECGVCFLLALQDECPASIDDFQHMIDAQGLAVLSRCVNVPTGGACEGSGECGTDDNANNCFGASDVYRRVKCVGEYIFEPQQQSPPPPVPRPPLPPPPTPAASPRTTVSLSLPRSAREQATAAVLGPQPGGNNSAAIVAVLVVGTLLVVMLACTRKRLYRAWRVQCQGAMATGLIFGGPLSASMIKQEARGGAEASFELGVLPPLEESNMLSIGEIRVLPVLPADPLAESRM